MKIIDVCYNIFVKDTRDSQLLEAKIRMGYFNDEKEELYALWEINGTKPLSGMYEDLKQLKISPQYELITPYKIITGKEGNIEKALYLTNLEDAKLVAREHNTIILDWKGIAL